MVGAPSLDMVFTSYNQSTNPRDKYQSRAESSTGYTMSHDSGTKWYCSFSNVLVGVDNLYSISRSSNAIQYWVSSPGCSQNDPASVMYIENGGGIGSYTYSAYRASNGYRPVVCLKSGISLKEVEAGKSYQI